MNPIYEAIEENNPQVKEKREKFLKDLTKEITNKKRDERHDYLSHVINVVMDYCNALNDAYAEGFIKGYSFANRKKTQESTTPA